MIKKLFCKHNYSRRWTTTTILNNGRMASLKIKECTKCGKVKTYTVPKGE